MEKKDLEDFLARHTALFMLPMLGILLKVYREKIEKVDFDSDKLADELSKDFKKVLLKAMIDYENIRSGALGPNAAKDKLRDLGDQIFEKVKNE